MTFILTISLCFATCLGSMDPLRARRRLEDLEDSSDSDLEYGPQQLQTVESFSDNEANRELHDQGELEKCMFCLTFRKKYDMSTLERCKHPYACAKCVHHLPFEKPRTCMFCRAPVISINPAKSSIQNRSDSDETESEENYCVIDRDGLLHFVSISSLAGHTIWQWVIMKYVEHANSKSPAFILQQGTRDIFVAYAFSNIFYLWKIRRNLGGLEVSPRTFLTILATALPFIAHAKSENAARILLIVYAASLGISAQFDNKLKILPKHLNFFVQYFPQASCTRIPLKRPDIVGDARRILLTWVNMFMIVSMFWGCLPKKWNGHFEDIEPFLKGPAALWQDSIEFAEAIGGSVLTEHDPQVHTLAFQIWNTVLFVGLMFWTGKCCVNSGQRIFTYNNAIVLGSAIFAGNHPPYWVLRLMEFVNYGTGVVAVILSFMADILLLLARCFGSSSR